MKRPYPYFVRNCILILAGWSAPLGLQAAQMAYEGFDYPVNDAPLATNLNGGSGWNGAWQVINGDGTDVAAASLTAGASSPSGYDLRSLGNKSNLKNGKRTGRFLDTSTNGPFGQRGYRDVNGRIGADGTTLYLSFLQQPNGTSSYYEFEFHRDNLGDGGRIGGVGNDQGGTNVNLRAPNGTHTIIGPGNANVNFYVVRIDFKAGNDDVFVYQNPTSTTEPTPTLTKLGAADMSFNGVSFGAFGGSRTVAHDEVRLGQTWADVTIPTQAAPVFVSHPQGSTTVFAGGTVSLTATANGYPAPTYQWYRGANLLTGQTSSTLTLSNVQAGDAGAYHVVATNSQGAPSSSDGTVVVQSTPAGLLAYEGFNYDTGSSNMNGKGGGLGWAAPWTAVDGGGGNVQGGNLAAGTNAPNGYDAQSFGNSSFIPNAKRDGRLLDTSPGGRLGLAGYIDGNGQIGADGKTLYLSFLQQPDGTSLFYEFEFHNKNGLGDSGRIGGVGNDTNNPTVGLRTGGSTTLIGPGSTGVNFYVVRIDFKAGNDDVFVYQNPVSATEPGVPTLTKLGASDMSFNGLSVAAFVNNRTVKHDEIRLGQSWSDVVFGTSRRNLTWTGNGTTNNWDFVSNNWKEGVTPTTFVDGDPVNFDDTGSASPAVNVVANVATASLNIGNSTNNYTFGGTGTITASGGLHKTGTASLTITAPTSFGSSVILDAGDVALNGTSTVSGNLALAAGFGNLTLGGSNTFNGSLLDSSTSGDRIFSGNNSFTGLSTLHGNVTFSGTTNFTGSGSVIWFGNFTGSNASVTIEPGAVINITGSYNDALVFGRDGGNASVVQNGGTVTYNPSNRGEAFLGASADNTGTNPTYQMKGGVLDMSGKRLGIALGGSAAGVTAVFTQTGGSVLVRQLDMGANLGFGDATYTLESGSLTVGEGGITSTSNIYTIDLGGGTVGAAGDWASLLDMTLTGVNGNTSFDTSDHTVRLSGAIDGTAGLVKNGTGALILTGFNSYSGVTQVNAGTIGGRGTGDNSAVTVASGATLAPGDLLADTFTCPSAVLASGSTFHVKIDNEIDFADQLQALSTVDITGVNLTSSEIGAGIVAAGSELVIVDAFGGRSGTFAGLPEGASIDTGVNTFTIHYTPTQVRLTSTTVNNPYATWAASKGLDGSPGKDPAFDADPEADGIANGLEWVLGGNPLASDGASLVAATANTSAGITLEFNREETSIGMASLVVQWSTDLGFNWIDVPVTQTGGSYANGVVVSVNEASTPDRVTVTIPASNDEGGRLFARLLVTLPE